MSQRSSSRVPADSTLLGSILVSTSKPKAEPPHELLAQTLIDCLQDGGNLALDEVALRLALERDCQFATSKGDGDKPSLGAFVRNGNDVGRLETSAKLMTSRKALEIGVE